MIRKASQIQNWKPLGSKIRRSNASSTQSSILNDFSGIPPPSINVHEEQSNDDLNHLFEGEPI